PERAQAFELADDIQVHGFLTQGYFLTSDNRIFGTSESGGSFDFTEIGINASWTPVTDLRLAGQLLFRRAGDGHEHDLELDFGLLDYTIFSRANYGLGMRLGRIKNPYGFYNETRDVLFTKPTILLPQSIYFERTRELSLSADGGLLYGEYRRERDYLTLELGMGIPRGANLDSELGLLGEDYPGKTHSKLSYIGRLGYDLESGKYRMAISSMWVDTRYDPKLLPPEDYTSMKFLFKPVIFSAQYNGDKISLTSEYAIRPFEQTILDNHFRRSIIGQSYYLQAQYRFKEDLEAIVRYDVLYNNRDDKSGQKYQALTGKPNYSQFAKDWTFGLRYYYNPSLLIAAEYHFVNGTAWLPVQDNPDPSSLEQRWHLFSLAASYRF
ncbi:MAG: hypothetical protein HGB05_08970, partial [Chloroflexi bacterium]|nr:hypothetical protein [Chloroflexota bacterium]